MSQNDDWLWQPGSLRHLLRVIPIDTALEIDGGELRFRCLEVYTEGCRLYCYYIRLREGEEYTAPTMELFHTPDGDVGAWLDMPPPDSNQTVSDSEDLSDSELEAIEKEMENADWEDNSPENSWLSPEQMLWITDNLGNLYLGGFGGGGGDKDEVHVFYLMEPLHPDARELQVEVRPFDWMHDSAPERKQRGPWKIRIEL